MYRFVKHVENKIQKEYNEDVKYGWPDKSHYIGGGDCLKDFSVLARAYKKEYIIDSTCRYAVKNGYLDQHGQQLEMTEKGKSLIEGYGRGFLREAITKEWKFVTLLLPILAFVLGLFTDEIKTFIIKTL
jgi:hypothetical protein